MKKTLLIFCLLLTTLSSWAHDFEVDGIYYKIISTAYMTVSVSYQGSSYSTFSNEYTGKVMIPAMVSYNGKDYSVTSIETSAFRDCEELTMVTIPESVTNIGINAFENCTGLSALTIPGTMKAIGNFAFNGCTGLKDLVIKEISDTHYDDYDVTTNISAYTKREKQWVWDETSSRWYILNNQNEYEPYGIYATDKVTWYEGKLSIVDGHEWEYTDGSWKDLGEVSGSQSIEYIEMNSENKGYIDLGVTFKANTRVQIKHYPTNAGGGAFLGDKGTNLYGRWHFLFSGGKVYYDFDSSRLSTTKDINTLYEWEVGDFYIKDMISGNYILNGTAHTNFSNRIYNISLWPTYDGNLLDYGRVYYVKIYEGQDLVRDLVPYHDGNNFGLWDNVEGKPYMPTGTLTGKIADTTNYPKYYEAKGAPTIIDGTLNMGYNTYNSTGKGKGLFGDCPLETLYLGRDLSYNTEEQYGWSPFENNTTLSSVTISEGVTSIEFSTFGSCYALTSIVIPGSVSSIGINAFADCRELTSVTIKNGVETLSQGVFARTKIAEITIPNSVKYIGAMCFEDCQKLTSVTSYATTPPTIQSSTFSGIGSNAVLRVLPGCKAAYQASAYWATAFSTITESFVVDGITYNCTSVVDKTVEVTASTPKYSGSINIPRSVTFMGTTYAVTSVGANAFTDCTELTSVTLSNTLVSIGSYAFSGCTSLTEVTGGWNMTSIGSYAFNGCDKLKKFHVPDGVKKIEDYTFYGCKRMTELRIGSGVDEIGNYAFNGCTLLNIYNYAEFPQNCGTNVFTVAKPNCNLYVADESRAYYSVHQDWYEFFIQPMDEEMTAIENIDDNWQLRIDKELSICDLSGRKLSQMQKGLNIVKMSDGSTRKVMVK